MPGVSQLFAVVAMSFACVLHFAMSSSAFHLHVFQNLHPFGFSQFLFCEPPKNILGMGRDLPWLPCHSLACCILPCHPLHFIRMFFKTCIRSGSPGSLRCPFGVQTSRARPSPLSDLVFVSGLKTFSKWTEVCQAAFVYHR